MDESILYVDDDESNLAVLEATCINEFKVLTASSGEVALDILRQREIAVLLADQRMPGMTGVEILESARKEYPDVVRIIITAYSDLSDAIDAINRGHVRLYLRKPWEPNELIATLHQALEIYRSNRKLRQLERRLVETERIYALGVIAASLAHDLRNPLTTLAGYLEISNREARNLSACLEREGLSDPEHLDRVTKLVGRLSDAKMVVEQVFAITRGVDLGYRQDGDRSSADIEEVIKLTLMVVNSAVVNRARIIFTMKPAPKVSGSPTKISQLVSNLLVNALEALPDRPRDENVIHIRLRLEDRFVVMEVEDNGRGIAPKILDQVFDAFFTTKFNGGAGLGLSITRRIIEEVGGDISVTSEEGKGTCFTIRLPVADE